MLSPQPFSVYRDLPSRKELLLLIHWSGINEILNGRIVLTIYVDKPAQCLPIGCKNDTTLGVVLFLSTYPCFSLLCVYLIQSVELDEFTLHGHIGVTITWSSLVEESLLIHLG